jgi:hypothetical protein
MAAVENEKLIPFSANIVPEDWLTPDPQTAAMLNDFLSQLEVRGYTTVVFRNKLSK